MSVETIPAGAEMDMLVAEKVMGWRDCGIDVSAPAGIHAWKGRPPGSEEWKLLPAFSTYIASAWQVVEKLGPLFLALHRMGVPGNAQAYKVELGDHEDHSEVSGPTAPLAICRAALKAVGL